MSHRLETAGPRAGHPVAEEDLPDYLPALAAVRWALERHVALAGNNADNFSAEAPDPSPPRGGGNNTNPRSGRQAKGGPLQTLGRVFGLSDFERDVLMLCAGVELDSALIPLCAQAQADPRREYPTFGLALAALPDADWGALLPDAPLRFWKLLHRAPDTNLTTGELRIDERILHFLVGYPSQDRQLQGILETVEPLAELAASHRRLAAQITAAWRNSEDSGRARTVVQLCGSESAGKREIAAHACRDLGLRLQRLPVECAPTTTAEIETLIRLTNREARLAGLALWIDADDLSEDHPQRQMVIRRFSDQFEGHLILSLPQRQRGNRRADVSFEVVKPTKNEQRREWRNLDPGLDPTYVDHLVGQFHLGGPQIHGAWSSAQGQLSDPATPSDTENVQRALWLACRMQARPDLSDLAHQIEPQASLDDLVLPRAQRQLLREIIVQVRHRQKVYDTWGFAETSTRGLGISALFSGPSGTGKTMASEVIAAELDLDLFRIDLSSIVSKYIGETEKNLRRVFDAAEEGGAILLFDEADAIFGKRSEVKDSHDRHANVEVSYLLQRMESYRGLSILTTNLKDSLDVAFLRRLRFLVDFPFPNSAQRAEIWRRVFPRKTPTEGLRTDRLARLNLTGGHIRNIALNAAFLAAETGHPISMRDLLVATRRELRKLGKPMPEADVRDWLE